MVFNYFKIKAVTTSLFSKVIPIKNGSFAHKAHTYTFFSVFFGFNFWTVDIWFLKIKIWIQLYVASQKKLNNKVLKSTITKI